MEDQSKCCTMIGDKKYTA